MDERAKQMALQHIEEGEYKQAFAILDDFRDDVEAMILLGNLDEIMHQDKPSYLVPIVFKSGKNAEWFWAIITAILAFILFATIILYLLSLPAIYWFPAQQ
jgi:hypothetical protein